MGEMEFDRTRKAINAKNLDSDSRREMLNKLTSAGGKVLREKSSGSGSDKQKKGSSASAKSPEYILNDAEDAKLPSERYKEQIRQEGDLKSAIRNKQMLELANASSFISHIIIKMKCKMAGLVPFTRRSVSSNFMSLLNLEGKQAIMECNLVANDIFMLNPEAAQKIIKTLDEQQPVYVELIERAAELYDPKELKELLDAYNYAPEEPVPLDVIRAPLFSLLRKLYYMKSYQETYIMAVNAALDILSTIEKRQHGFYAAKKRKVNSDWKILMNDIYPKMVLLAQRTEMKYAEPKSWIFDEMLGVVRTDMPGSRKKGDPVGKAAKEDKKTEEDTEEDIEVKEVEEEEKEIPPVLKFGLRLIKEIPLEKLRKKHDLQNEYKKIPNNDKVFLTYLFFKEFEAEYSFLLTTQKIQAIPGYEKGKRKDYRRSLVDIYNKLRICHENFRQYHHQNSEYLYSINEAGATVDNYVEHAKQVQKLENRRGATGASVRESISEFMREVVEIFEIFIEDMNGPEKIIQNKKDLIVFNAQIEGTRKLNNKSVQECIYEACAYAYALFERLNSGDLYGGVIEMGEEDFAKAFLPESAENDSFMNIEGDF